jgi:hypothetical protein
LLLNVIVLWVFAICGGDFEPIDTLLVDLFHAGRVLCEGLKSERQVLTQRWEFIQLCLICSTLLLRYADNGRVRK